jgi:hypothetical protein
MPTEVLTKLEIAERQLNRAISLLIEDNDRVSSITLAGAAEEILAALLKSVGKTDVLSEICHASADMGRAIGETWKTKTFKYDFNFVKNELKHHDNGCDHIPIFEEAPKEIISRAIENFRRISGNYSHQMQTFISKYS